MVIGFAGNKGSGKNTAGNYLFREYGFTEYAFADKVREAVAILLDVHPSNLDFWKNNPDIEITITEKGYDIVERKTIRKILQRMGTEVGRNIFGEDLWVDLLFKEIQIDDLAVITDVRFQNEVDFINDCEGIVIRLHREFTEIDSHPSERIDQLGGIYQELSNNLEIQDLERDLDLLMRNLGIPKK